MRTKAKSWIGAALTALLAAGCFAGCGKDAALEPANGTDEAQPAEAVIEKEPVQEAERTFRTGLTITNNGMFDGERTNPEFDTLYAAIEDVEIWGQGELSYDIQAEGMILRKFVVRNHNASPVVFRMDPLEKADVIGDLSRLTDYQFTEHPNGWEGYIEPGEEYALCVDVAPEKTHFEESFEGPLEIHFTVSVEVGGNSPETAGFVTTQNITAYSREEFSKTENYRGLVKGVIRDEDGNPIEGAVVRGTCEYNIRRMYVLTDENGEFSMKLPAFKTTYANAWKEAQLCVRKDGYSARQIIVYPKTDQEVSVDMTLFAENELLNYEETGSIDLGLQAYENSSDGSSIIAYVPFHTGMDSSLIKDRIRLTAADYEGNRLFEYALPEEQPYVKVSGDGKYIVTNENTASDQSKGNGWKTVILDREGNVVYSIDHFPVEEKEYQPSESEANSSISRCAGISNNGRYLVTGNVLGNVWVIDWQNDEVLWQDYTFGQVRTVDFSEDDSRIYISSGDGYYRCYSIDGELLWKTFVDTWATKVKLTDDAIALTTKCGADTLKVLERDTGKIRWTYPTMQTSLAMDVSGDGRYLWYGGHSSSGYSVIADAVFDMETGEILYSLGFDNAVAGCFCGDGSKLIVSDRNGVYVFQTSDGSCLWSKQMTEEKDLSCSFSANANDDGSRIAVTANTDPSAVYYGQAYFFALTGTDPDPEYNFNHINIEEHQDLAALMNGEPTEEDEQKLRELEYDSTAETAIGVNQTITLSKDCAAFSDNYMIRKDFTVSCEGYSFGIGGSLEAAGGTMEIIKASNVYMPGLELHNDGKAADGSTIIRIKGGTTRVRFPDGMGEGKERRNSNGFYWEKENGDYLIKYDGSLNS